MPGMLKKKKKIRDFRSLSGWRPTLRRLRMALRHLEFGRHLHLYDAKFSLPLPVPLKSSRHRQKYQLLLLNRSVYLNDIPRLYHRRRLTPSPHQVLYQDSDRLKLKLLLHPLRVMILHTSTNPKQSGLKTPHFPPHLPLPAVWLYHLPPPHMETRRWVAAKYIVFTNSLRPLYHR